MSCQKDKNVGQLCGVFQHANKKNQGGPTYPHKMTLSIVEQAIEAGSRKLGPDWCVEVTKENQFDYVQPDCDDLTTRCKAGMWTLEQTKRRRKMDINEKIGDEIGQALESACFLQTEEEERNQKIETRIKNDQAMTSALAKNQHNYSKMEHATNSPDGECFSESTTWMKVLGENSTPFISEFVKQLGSRHLIGLQPMAGPVSLNYIMEYTYPDEQPELKNNEEPYHTFDGANGVEDASNCEGKPGRRMSLDIKKFTTEAASKRLSTKWSMETIQDLNAMMGLDLESELRGIMAAEVAVEYDHSVYSDLLRVAKKGHYGEYDLAGFDPLNTTDTGKLSVTINRAASDVARKTRRGTANWMVVSDNTFANCIEHMTSFKRAHRDEEVAFSGGIFRLVGKLNHTMRVYVNTFADDTILMGYKGTSEVDAGYFLTPYVPLMSSGMVVNPVTFQPTMSFMTRYGVLAHPKIENYYARIDLLNAPWNEVNEEDDGAEVLLGYKGHSPMEEPVINAPNNPFEEVEDELAKAMSAEITKEIDKELIALLTDKPDDYFKELERKQRDFLQDQFDRAGAALEGFGKLLD